MKKQLEMKEYYLKNGLTLKGIIDAKTKRVYFPIQALVKSAGYTASQAKGFKKIALKESSIKSFFEFREIPTKLKGQMGWVVYEESLPNLMLKFPRLRVINDKFPKEEEIIELREGALYDLNNIFPTFARVKKVFVINKDIEDGVVYIRDMRPRVSIKNLSKFFEIKQSYLEKAIEIVTKGVGRKYYSFEYKDLTIEGLNLLNGTLFFSGNKVNKLFEHFYIAQEYLIKEIYTKTLGEIGPELSELYLLENIDMGTIKVGVTKKLDKRIQELGTGSYRLSLLYSSKLISNAMEIKEEIMEDLKQYQRRNDWVRISADEILDIVKKYEKKMCVKKLSF